MTREYQKRLSSINLLEDEIEEDQENGSCEDGTGCKPNHWSKEKEDYYEHDSLYLFIRSCTVILNLCLYK